MYGEKVMLVTNKDLMLPALRETYAVGAFNITNLESLLAIAEAAIEENSPAIIAVTPSSIKYTGLTYVEKLVKTAAESTRVPMSFHLDHGKDLEIATKCIEAGFTSVMIDGSHLKFEKNITLTERVVNIAHPMGISVEAELGRLAGIEEEEVGEKEAVLTDPDAAEEFVKSTGVDTLAIAIGTSHGAYKFKGDPRLDFERLKLIRKKVDIPLVLHGASSVPSWIIEKAIKYGAELKGAKGIPEEHIKKAISLGIAKINIDTDIRLAFTGTVREFLTKSPEIFDPRKILGSAKSAMKEVVKNKMRLFGSSGKAG
jgi:fructose-bisphosphate aldolase class II